ncbi:MAG: hypothetical protein PVH30_06955 [Desulfobacterales bacterium]|jgi:Ser-tRNA(Ala) deacylase AlaX
MSKRYDPRMHTVEHILNQTMDRMFGCGRCVSAHIEKKKSKCDYRFDHPLTADETSAVADAVNRIIESDLPITDAIVSREDAQAEFSPLRLPESAGEPLRIVRVGDYDACPCIGQHVTRTADIGAFRITSTDFANGILRIRYKLGPPRGPLPPAGSPSLC